MKKELTAEEIAKNFMRFSDKTKEFYNKFQKFIKAEKTKEQTEETQVFPPDSETIIHKMAIVGLMNSVKSYADAVITDVTTNKEIDANTRTVLSVYVTTILNALSMLEEIISKEEKKAVARALAAAVVDPQQRGPNKALRTKQPKEETIEERDNDSSKEEEDLDIVDEELTSEYFRNKKNFN